MLGPDPIHSPEPFISHMQSKYDLDKWLSNFLESQSPFISLLPLQKPCRGQCELTQSQATPPPLPLVSLQKPWRVLKSHGFAEFSLKATEVISPVRSLAPHAGHWIHTYYIPVPVPKSLESHLEQTPFTRVPKTEQARL